MSFCLTGVLSRKREEIQAEIRAAGGNVHDSVKKTTTYLVAGDKTGKTKLDQAKKAGTEVISERRLEDMMSTH
jgi:DNA ligase (NAD+)